MAASHTERMSAPVPALGGLATPSGSGCVTLSVALCTYNGATHLWQQLQSIAAQTRRPDELVVCDDRSTDASVEMVEAFAAEAPFPVRLYVAERNRGSTQNFASAIAQCTGSVIVLADQDDVWLPEKLARTEAEFCERPGVGLVFTDAEVVDERLRPLGYRLHESVGADLKWRERLRRAPFQLLFTEEVVTGATLAFRSTYRDLVLPIPEEIPWLHDAWIALLISAVAEVALVPAPMLLYRQHPRQQIGAWKPGEGGKVAVHDEVQVARGVSRDAYLDLATRIEPVRRRLESRLGTYDGGDALAHVTGKIAHLRVRGTMPPGRTRRAMRIARELSTLRYHRYSRGLYSAIKDLLIP